jgi:signal transduction histidine kinase
MLRSIVQENIEDIRTEALKKQIDVRFTSAGDFPVFVDKKMMDIILGNILSNAVKFSYPDNSIDVEVREEENRNVVLIKDYGVGMEQVTLEKLFHLESKFSMPGTRQERGNGLGLLISKELIERNKGNIEVMSEFGKGTRFRIILPRA